ncbi:TPA: HNH endonuclease [Vibrio parahaemolyticus]|nr:HNH endonuclease [Vibrio parahaemolyticus]
MKIKICKLCEKSLNLNHFNKNKVMKDGYDNRCKECKRAQARNRYTHICSQCGINFNNSSKNSKYCSSQCSGEARRKRLKVNCGFCNRVIEVILAKYKKSTTVYCDIRCKAKHQKITLKGAGNPSYKRVSHACYGCNKKIDVVQHKLKNQKYIFCSNSCYKANIGRNYRGEKNSNYVKPIEKECLECKKKYKRKPHQFEHDNSYCSRECYFKSRKGLLKKERVPIKCHYCGDIFQILESQTVGKKSLYCSKSCKDKGHGQKYSGKSHPRYNNELTDEDRIVRRKHNKNYQWRIKVYERDGYTCQICKDSKGGNLVAHHLYSYSDNKALRFEVNNGITLCKDCHKEFHDSYGYGKNTKSQFERFKSDMTEE